ncbi:MAG: DUF805 domain-containing protein [Parasphingorhabdus sp.]
MFLPLKRYADFSGRSRRKEYWMFFLFQFLVQIAFIALMVLIILVGGADDGSTGTVAGFFVLIATWVLFWLAMLIPNVAIVVRRLHDQDIPGIVGILLYIGTVIFTLPGLVILVFMCLEGKKGDNQYGKDPKMNENVGDVFR